MNTHQQARQSLYEKAYKLTYMEAQKYTKTYSETAKIASDTAKSTLSQFDAIFPDPDLKKESEYKAFFEKIQELMPGIKTEQLFPTINELLECRKVLKDLNELFGVKNYQELSMRYEVLTASEFLLNDIKELYDITHSPNVMPVLTLKSNVLTMTRNQRVEKYLPCIDEFLADYIPKGEIEYFPKKVIREMLIEQADQNDIFNIGVFEQSVRSGSIPNGYDKGLGFYWGDSEKGMDFWQEVVFHYRYDLIPDAVASKKISVGFLPKDYTGWVKSINLNKFLAYCENGVIQYGFTHLGVWCDDKSGIGELEIEATEEEALAVFSEYADRNGYKGYNYHLEGQKLIGKHNKATKGHLIIFDGKDWLPF